jgi:hypothetical protein
VVYFAIWDLLGIGISFGGCMAQLSRALRGIECRGFGFIRKIVTGANATYTGVSICNDDG